MQQNTLADCSPKGLLIVRLTNPLETSLSCRDLSISKQDIDLEVGIVALEATAPPVGYRKTLARSPFVPALVTWHTSGHFPVQWLNVNGEAF